MRRAFDSILSGAVAAAECAAALASKTGEFGVLSFEDGLPIAPQWRILDDVVSWNGLLHRCGVKSVVTCVLEVVVGL